MNVLRLLNRVKSGEGLRLNPYQDHKGVWTIGYGSTHMFGKKVDASWKKISKQDANNMLHLNLMNAIVAAHSSVKNFDSIGNIRQEAIAELVYQLGERGWLRFVKTRAHIEEFKFTYAAAEIKDSNLWRDPLTRSRCERYSRMILLGDSYESNLSPWL